jgi:carbamoyltransferase
VFACEEEKFTGIKHDSSFPINSINYILENYTDKIDLICYYENPKLKLKRALKHNIKSVPRILWTNVKLFFKLNKICRNIFYSTHHMSHMAYSYYTSPFNRATLVSVDGVGEEETMCVSIAKNNNITQIESTKYPHSLGLLYSAITAYLGFKPNEGEYKVMGLAPYGKDRFLNKMRSIVYLKKDGNYLLNLDLFSHHKKNMSFFLNKSSPNFLTLFNKNIEKYFGISFRKEDEPLKEVHYDLAYFI